tara:strand:- start:149 stop:316 length:168 start_codon:yes stop_codon:yes gene_type:complete
MPEIFGFAIFASMVAAWLTHVVHCFTAEAWGLLIGGAIFFPIAVVNGIGIWFGFW